MTDNSDEPDPAPQTIGELRQRLAELGDPWQVDPTLSDDELLPDPPRGGAEPTPDVAESLAVATPAADADIAGLIAVQPPANPHLRERWVELGLLDEEDDPS